MILLRVEENGLEVFLMGKSRARASICNSQTIPFFFSRVSMEKLQSLEPILLVFGHVSGLKINLDKSTLFGIELNLRIFNGYHMS